MDIADKEHIKIVYPFNSRRIGKLLSINLSPSEKKVCSFNCTYCALGITKNKRTFISPNECQPLQIILDALTDGFEEYASKKFDGINLAGTGEPTLYPFFPQAAAKIIELRDKYFPGIKTSVFTNCTRLDDEDVIKGLLFFDRRICKLDAITDKTLMRINCPNREITVKKIINGLKRLKNIELSTGVIDSPTGNYEELKSDEFANIIKDIRPIKIQIYEFDRPVPRKNGFIEFKVSKDRLLSIADIIFQKTKIPVEVIYSDTKRGIHDLLKNDK